MGISMVAWPGRDIDNSTGHQSARRTAAMASLKVGSGLAYQAAVRGCGAVVASPINSPAHSVTSENNPSSTGVVRRMAGRTTAAGSRYQDDGGGSALRLHPGT